MKGIMFPKEIDSCTLMHDNGTSTTDIELIYKKKKEKKHKLRWGSHSHKNINVMYGDFFYHFPFLEKIKKKKKKKKTLLHKYSNGWNPCEFHPCDEV